MRKIIELDDYFPKTGETTVQLVLPWGGGRQDTSRITKYASEALDYIKHVAPEPGKTHLLLLALGGEETYGPNRNGDGFPERPVAAKGKHANVRDPWWVAPGEELTRHYQTFETNPAHAFKHHQNKDPAKASGVVKKAFWNDRMKRVELLTSVDNDKDPEWVERVEAGEFPAVSMGCKIKYDVCSICGNKAPTRADYCDCVRMNPGMNGLTSEGKKAYVHNPSPNFFDISRVFRPADRTGYTLKKVADAIEIRTSAELGEEAEAAEAKAGAARKLSEIDKVIRGEPLATSVLSPDEQSFICRFRDHAQPKLAGSPDVPLALLLRWPTRDVLAAVEDVGVVLKDAEFIPYVAGRLAGGDLRLSPALIERVASLAASALDLFADSPALFDEVVKSGGLDRTEKAPDALLTALASFRVKRAYAGELLYRRLVPEGMGIRRDEAPRTDLLHVTDPTTGRVLTTTRGAAVDAQDEVTRAHIRKALGGSALLLGGYKMLTAFPSMRRLRLPLAAGAGYLGYRTLGSRPGGEVRTDEGFSVPDSTEFAPKTAAIVHLIEAAAGRPRPRDLHAVKIGSVCSLDAVAEAFGAAAWP